MNTPLPSKQEWEESGFTVPAELCGKPSSIAGLVAAESAKATAQSPDMRAIIAELRGIQAALEANLRAIALVRVTNLLRRLDESPHEGPQ